MELALKQTSRRWSKPLISPFKRLEISGDSCPRVPDGPKKSPTHKTSSNWPCFELMDLTFVNNSRIDPTAGPTVRLRSVSVFAFENVWLLTLLKTMASSWPYCGMGMGQCARMKLQVDHDLPWTSHMNTRVVAFVNSHVFFLYYIHPESQFRSLL